METPEYRAWIKAEGVMRHVSMLYLDRQMAYCPLIEVNDIGFGKEYKYDEIELMQYIHEKDSHGMRIFEGDIIEHRYMEYAGHGNVDERTEFVAIKDMKNIPFSDATIGVSVIGNIYENMELLEDKYNHN